MKISNLFLVTLATAATTPCFASANNGIVVFENVHQQSASLRGLKKTKTADAAELDVSDDVPAAEPTADVAVAPAEGEGDTDAQAPAEGEGGDATGEFRFCNLVLGPIIFNRSRALPYASLEKEEDTDDTAEEDIDEAFSADDEAGAEAEETAVGVEGGQVSPYVWYSVGGVVALVVAYFACCKKSDDGYSRIQ
ncbi:hypothetical protein HJC23_010558 [Cyclotella cryptica]|uniref:Transmembrane protein n=1 Tax=Cyclotella cryptica TaxID=29204 RepID=A0ABD3QBJ7_9STRA